MRVQFSSTPLCSSDPASRLGPVAPSFNGQPVLDVAQYFRADFATIFGRGDGPVEFSFGVWAKFASEAEVIAFCSSHRESLPVQADLVLTDDEQSVAYVMADAVRSVRFAEVIGTSVLVNYTFTGARFESDDVPAAPTDTDTVKTGYVALTAADTSKAIVFDVPFASKPRYFTATIAIPGGGTVTAVSPAESYTEAGGTFNFASIPASGYVLHWLAVL